MREKIKGVYTKTFSLGEFVSHVKTIDISIRESNTDGKWGNDFFGCKTHKEALAICERGHIPSEEMAKLSAVDNIDSTSTINPVYDVYGILPDVGLFLQGIPECMMDLQQTWQDVRTLRLAVMCNVTAGVSVKEITKHMTEVYKIVRAYQNSGYAVTMNALFYNSIGGGTESLMIEVVKEGELLSPAMMGVVFHTSFYRNMWFSYAQDRYGNDGGSIAPPKTLTDINGAELIVIPSSQFLKGKTIESYIAEGIASQEAAAEMASL